MRQYPAPNAHRKTASQLLNKAWRLLQRGELGKSSSVCRIVLARQPDNTDAGYLLGVVLLQQGRLSEAEDRLGAVLRLQPTNVGAQLNYGNVLAQLNRADEALTFFEKVISMRPDLCEAQLNHGNALNGLRRYEEALASYTRALGMPRDLYSEAFFDDCRNALAPGGIALVHLWSLDPQSSLYLDRMKRSFSGRVLTMALGQADSTIAVGLRDRPAELSWAALRERAVAFEAAYGLEFSDFVERLRNGAIGQVLEALP
jgi:tetratricopeptide (TPR) repeat protein